MFSLLFSFAPFSKAYKSDEAERTVTHTNNNVFCDTQSQVYPQGCFDGAQALAEVGTSQLRYRVVLPCLPGYMCTTGDASVLNIDPCSPGTFSLAFASTCTRCPPGSISGQMSSFCSPCSPGFYEESNTVCLPCPSGHYSSIPGSGVQSCTPCSAGLVTPSGSSFCGLPCPAGSYLFIDKSTPICKLCETGTYSNVIGLSYDNSTSASPCLPCTRGGVCNTPGMVYPNLCPPVTFNNETNSSLLFCPPCINGVAPSSGSVACISCPPNFSPNNERTICISDPIASPTASPNTITPSMPPGIPSTSLSSSGNFTPQQLGSIFGIALGISLLVSAIFPFALRAGSALIKKIRGGGSSFSINETSPFLSS